MTDSILIKQFNTGNKEAFSALYQKYIEKIYKFVFYKTMHKETAEDLTSTIFFKALDKLNTFEGKKAKFQTWLYNIARNTVIDYYRTKKPNIDVEDFWGIADKNHLETTVENVLQLEEVRKYLHKLKPDQREIIILRVWEGLSYKEIAQIVGKSENACKVNFSRTVSKLKDNVLLIIIFGQIINIID